MQKKDKIKTKKEKDITCMLYYANSKQSGGGQASISQGHLASDALKRICFEKTSQYNVSVV